MTRYLIVASFALLIAACSTNQSATKHPVRSYNTIDADKNITDSRKLDKDAMDKLNLSLDEYRGNIAKAISDLESIRNEFHELMINPELAKTELEELQNLISEGRIEEALKLNTIKYQEKLKDVHARFLELERFLLIQCYEPIKQ